MGYWNYFWLFMVPVQKPLISPISTVCSLVWGYCNAYYASNSMGDKQGSNWKGGWGGLTPSVPLFIPLWPPTPLFLLCCWHSQFIFHNWNPGDKWIPKGHPHMTPQKNICPSPLSPSLTPQALPLGSSRHKLLLLLFLLLLYCCLLLDLLARFPPKNNK